MARSIAHRGPDDEGFFIAGPVGLGFRRLSIIDLAGGHQPMSDAEETVWIIFNGEIYNYKELRAELQSKGHQFRTNSDTEVIVHGYKEWGTMSSTISTACLDSPSGMCLRSAWSWRVMRWASNLFIIVSTMGQLTFGSEIRAILAAEDHRPEVDPVALNLFLRFRYTPSPFTIFKASASSRRARCWLWRTAMPRGAVVQF